MLLTLIIFIFLFLISTISFLLYFLTSRKTVRTINSNVNVLLSALKELKAGNLAKEIKKFSSISKIPFDKNLNKLSNKIKYAAEEFNNITLKPLKRLCYVGADSYLEGRVSGEKMAELLNKEGEVAIVQIKFNLTGTVLRKKI